jgi:hypothetical protein
MEARLRIHLDYVLELVLKPGKIITPRRILPGSTLFGR